MLKPPCLAVNHLNRQFPRRNERVCVNPFQGYENHREFPHIFFAQSTCFRNGQPFKNIFPSAQFKETFQHAHIQCFSKSPWPGKQRYLPPVLQQFPDQSGFIHIVKALCPNFFKIFDPYREFLFSGFHGIPVLLPPVLSHIITNILIKV